MLKWLKLPTRVAVALGAGVIAAAGLAAAPALSASAATAHPAAATHVAGKAVPSLGDAVAIPVHPTTYIGPVVKGAAEVPLTGEFVLRMRSDSSEYVTNEGTGVDAKIETSGYSTWNIVGNCGGDVENLQNQSGGYLRAKSAGDVQDSDTCDANSEWTGTNDGTGVEWSNVGTGGKLSVATDTNGSGVKVGASWLIDSYSS